MSNFEEPLTKEQEMLYELLFDTPPAEREVIERCAEVLGVIAAVEPELDEAQERRIRDRARQLGVPFCPTGFDLN